MAAENETCVSCRRSRWGYDGRDDSGVLRMVLACVDPEVVTSVLSGRTAVPAARAARIRSGPGFPS